MERYVVQTYYKVKDIKLYGSESIITDNITSKDEAELIAMRLNRAFEVGEAVGIGEGVLKEREAQKIAQASKPAHGTII